MYNKLYGKKSDNMNKHKAKKHFGQNFLTDKNLLNKIVEEANIENKDVIEIGPGMGALTQFLVKKAKTVTAYEIDLDLKRALNQLEKEHENLTIKFEDILKVEIPKDKTYDVVANIPYNITSPIIFKLLDTPNINSATLMVQKEVCDRITSKPGTKDYNALTVIINYYMKVRRIINVSKKLFRPVPKVDSAVFQMIRREKELNDDEEKLFIEIVKSSFHQKRKTLLNNLSFSFETNKEKINEMLQKLNINSSERAENITLEQFIELTKSWNNIKNS